MNFAEPAIRNRTFTLVMVVVTIFGGIYSFNNLSRLEDPEFTIKDALVITSYPGASAQEVEEEVSDEIEEAVQQMGQLDEVTSRSQTGLSTVTVTIKDKYDKDTLPQVWDELRRKVNDAQGNLPPGANTSVIIDDYGDVYGVFFALYGPEYTYAELKDVADYIKKELLLVDQVAKVDLTGDRRECIYIELNRDRVAALAIPVKNIESELQERGVVADAGRIQVGQDYIQVNPTGGFDTVESFERLLITAEGGAQFRLGDIAEVRRGYVEPPNVLLRHNGYPAIGIGVSTVSGGNVVEMGDAIDQRMREILPNIPLGIDFGIISLQSDTVVQAINGFVVSLVQAVAIVIVVLLFFMGFRSGMIIGFVLLLTIVATFIFMLPWGVALERISLGALIIALGMLVDNAIVVIDGMLTRIKNGMPRRKAAIDIVRQSALPLLGATAIAIMAFAAIGVSQDSTGEFCRSLYQVILISLSLSWVTAVTVTPVLGIMFLKPPDNLSPEEEEKREQEYLDADQSEQTIPDEIVQTSGFYRSYQGILELALRFRFLTLAIIAAVFFLCLYGFGFVSQSFFPPSTRPQFQVDVYLPQGVHLDITTSVVKEVEEYISGLDGVTNITSSIGQGTLRFLLTYGPEKKDSGYALLLVDVDDPKKIDSLIAKIDRYFQEKNALAYGYGYKFELGPGAKGKIAVQFIGEDPKVLRSLGEQAVSIFRDEPNAKAVRTEWRQAVKTLFPEMAEEPANIAGVSRSQIAATIQQGFDGVTVGVYREGDLLLPVKLRAQASQREDISSLYSLQIWSRTASSYIPLLQVLGASIPQFQDEVIIREDRKPTFTVFCDPKSGTASDLFKELRPRIENGIDLPAGYEINWAGEYESSSDAQAGLAGNIPFFVLAMILVTIALFNSLKQPLVIWLCVPLALIGVTIGLLSTGQPFGFMALLGFLSLSGMLIKNAIVLIDEINAQRGGGVSPYNAIVNAGTSRLRPVAMAAATTVLGMFPLLLDDFFVSMAVTIMFGLSFATILTMVIVPTLYSVFFGVKRPDQNKSGPAPVTAPASSSPPADDEIPPSPS